MNATVVSSAAEALKKKYISSLVMADTYQIPTGLSTLKEPSLNPHKSPLVAQTIQMKKLRLRDVK